MRLWLWFHAAIHAVNAQLLIEQGRHDDANLQKSFSNDYARELRRLGIQ